MNIKTSWMPYVWVLVLALFCLSVVTMLSNAIYNVLLGVTLLGALIHAYQHKDWAWPSRGILLGTSLFFLCFVASILGHPEGAIINKTLSYVSWSLPFWPIFYWARKAFYRKGILAGIWIGLLSLCVSAAILPANHDRWVGFYSQPNILANVIEIVWPLFLLLGLQQVKEKAWRWASLNGLVTLVSLGVLAMTASRGAWMGLVGAAWVTVGLVIYGHYARQWRKACLMTGAYIGLVIIAGLVALQVVPGDAFSRTYDYERILLWQSAFHMWQDNPCFGIGWGHWNEVYVQGGYISSLAKEPDLPHAHNTFMQFLSATGALGAFGYICFVVGQLVDGLRMGISSSLREGKVYALALVWICLSVVIHGLVDIGIGHRFMMYNYFMILGLLAGVMQVKRGNVCGKGIVIMNN
ncbi:MAG: O-antigen ligase family protein [Veillonella sp.]|nr:O-antigen ligase family protein [Veillonella sp.]